MRSTRIGRWRWTVRGGRYAKVCLVIELAAREFSYSADERLPSQERFFEAQTVSLDSGADQRGSESASLEAPQCKRCACASAFDRDPASSLLGGVEQMLCDTVRPQCTAARTNIAQAVDRLKRERERPKARRQTALAGGRAGRHA